MKSFELKGTVRESLGKKSTKALRVAAKIPCVLYGGEENIHFSAEESDFRYLVYTPNAYIVNIIIGDKKIEAILKDIQFHPVTDKILHVDFLQIFDDKKINIGIPVLITGLAEGVKMGGKLLTAYRKLNVRGLKKDLPDTLNVDVTNVKLGSSIKVGELAYENLELLDSKNAVVASVKLNRATKEDTLSEEGEAGEETPAATAE